jgi:hypothetical protein
VFEVSVDAAAAVTACLHFAENSHLERTAMLETSSIEDWPTMGIHPEHDLAGKAFVAGTKRQVIVAEGTGTETRMDVRPRKIQMLLD